MVTLPDEDPVNWTSWPSHCPDGVGLASKCAVMFWTVEFREVVEVGRTGGPV